MEIISNGKKSKTNQRVNSKSLRFEVRIVPLDAYPDLKENPANPYTQMSDDDRMDELIDILGLLWAETCLDEAAKRLPVPKDEKKRLGFSVVGKG
ncbi:MAG: hypothetical protein A2Z83_05840 [Omnitrophica bacterium GWA2_52_8]|nr:MAG: hypothetical protein A2Z83_05840 [Omnitrophica bacterium GWA2_52_8]